MSRNKPSPAEREGNFQQHLADTACYHAAVVADGGTLWWLDTKKLAKLERHYPGIARLPATERRRALFLRRYKQPTPPAL